MIPTTKYCLLFVSMTVLFGTTSAQVQFDDADFAELLQKASASDKRLMVDAYTDWCGWCKVMDKETFADSATGIYMNSRFINTKINMEEDFGIDLAMKYRVNQFPQFLFFDTDGQLIARLSGFLKPTEFVSAVEDVIYAKPHLPKGRAPLDFSMDYPDWYRNSFLKNQERSYPDAQVVESWLDGRNDLSDEVSWGVMNRFVSGGKYALRIAQMRDSLKAKYGEAEVNAKISSLIFNDVKAAIKDRDESILNHALQACDNYLGEEAPRYKLRYRMYYHQMTDNWPSYANTVEEMKTDSSLYDEATYVYAAQTIANLSQDERTLMRAKNWINELIKKDEGSYALFVLYASLSQKTGDFDTARSYANRALNAAKEEGKSPAEAQEILDQLP